MKTPAFPTLTAPEISRRLKIGRKRRAGQPARIAAALCAQCEVCAVEFPGSGQVCPDCSETKGERPL